MKTKLKAVFALALSLAFLPALASARITERTEVLSGHVVLTRVGQNDLAVLIDHLPIGGDGVADQAFLYRSSSALPAGLGEISGAATLVVRPDTVIVALVKGPVVSLIVPAESGETPLQRESLLKGAGTTTVDSGFQLTRLYGRKGIDLVSAALSQLRPRLDAPSSFLKAGGGGEDDDIPCAAGGPGSNGCTITTGPLNCSVSCSSGYYACCTINGCHCRSASGGGGEEVF